MWGRACSLVHILFCRPHLPTVLRTCKFLTFWSANWALATVLCTFCGQLLQSEPRTRGNGDCTSATTGDTLPKKDRVSRPSVLTPVNSHMGSPSPPPGTARKRGIRSSSCPGRTSCSSLRAKLQAGAWGSECQVVRLAALRAERMHSVDQGVPSCPLGLGGTHFAQLGCIFNSHASEFRWHDDVVDMMVEMVTMTIVCNSEVSYN